MGTFCDLHTAMQRRTKRKDRVPQSWVVTVACGLWTVVYGLWRGLCVDEHS